MVTELMDFLFSRVHRVGNASEVSDRDLDAAILEGTDFGCGNRRSRSAVHNQRKH